MAHVLVNRGGGSVGDDDEATATKIRDALAAAGIDAELELIEGQDIAERAAAIAKRGDQLLIVGGGDGSQSAAAGALAGTDTALGILPLGTLNHLARDLGIPAELDGAAAVIATGHRRRIDVAELNGRVFINNSAIGLYPLMVLDRETQQKRLGRSKRLALLVASARTLLRFHHQRLALTAAEGQASVDTPLLFVGNNDYRIAFPAAGQRDRLDDGALCVLVLRKSTRAGFVAAALRALIGRTRADDMIRLDAPEQLRVDSRRSVLAVAVDGETLHLKPPLDYRIRKAALTVIAPPAKPPEKAR